MYCNHCKKDFPKETKYCPECGNKLHGTDTQPSDSKNKPNKRKSLIIAGVLIAIAIVGLFFLPEEHEEYREFDPTMLEMGSIIYGDFAFIDGGEGELRQSDWKVAFYDRADVVKKFRKVETVDEAAKAIEECFYDDIFDVSKGVLDIQYLGPVYYREATWAYYKVNLQKPKKTEMQTISSWEKDDEIYMIATCSTGTHPDNGQQIAEITFCIMNLGVDSTDVAGSLEEPVSIEKESSNLTMDFREYKSFNGFTGQDFTTIRTSDDEIRETVQAMKSNDEVMSKMLYNIVFNKLFYLADKDFSECIEIIELGKVDESHPVFNGDYYYYKMNIIDHETTVEAIQRNTYGKWDTSDWEQDDEIYLLFVWDYDSDDEEFTVYYYYNNYSASGREIISNDGTTINNHESPSSSASPENWDPIVDTGTYSVQLPKSWEGRYEISGGEPSVLGTFLSFYSVLETGESEFIGSLRTSPITTDLSGLMNYRYIGIIDRDESIGEFDELLIAEYPMNVFYPDSAQMRAELDEVVFASISVPFGQALERMDYIPRTTYCFDMSGETIGVPPYDFESALFALNFPDSWNHAYSRELTLGKKGCEYSVAFYESTSRKTDGSGWLFSIILSQDSLYQDSYENFGKLFVGSVGDYYVYIERPTEPTCAPGSEAVYHQMLADIPAVLDTFTPEGEFMFIGSKGNIIEGIGGKG